MLAAHPRQPKIWMSYGHALKTHGREADSIAAYDKSIELLPSLGEAYWSLANLKTVRFTTAQIESMRAQLARPDLADEDRFHLHFALGKALEDDGALRGILRALRPRQQHPPRWRSAIRRLTSRRRPNAASRC